MEEICNTTDVKSLLDHALFDIFLEEKILVPKCFLADNFTFSIANLAVESGLPENVLIEKCSFFIKLAKNLMFDENLLVGGEKLTHIDYRAKPSNDLDYDNIEIDYFNNENFDMRAFLLGGSDLIQDFVVITADNKKKALSAALHFREKGILKSFARISKVRP